MAAGGRIRLRPSRHAVMVALALGAMGAMAINHRSNAAWLMVCITFSAALASLAHGRANLAAVTVVASPTAPVAAGDPVLITVRGHNPGRRDVHGLRVMVPGGTTVAVIPLVPAGGDGEATLVLAAQPRGVWPGPGLEVSSAYPLGLARLWRMIATSGEVVVYPRPAGRALAAAADDGEGGAPREDLVGHEDFRGHRRHQVADSPRRIDWKASERSGSLLVKEWSGSSGSLVMLSWERTAGTTEARLSQLARWVTEADARGAPYGLRLPGTEIPPSTGASHRHGCLRALAAHPRDAGEEEA